jgi:hypothetical protein
LRLFWAAKFTNEESGWGMMDDQDAGTSQQYINELLNRRIDQLETKMQLAINIIAARAGVEELDFDEIARVASERIGGTT